MFLKAKLFHNKGRFNRLKRKVHIVNLSSLEFSYLFQTLHNNSLNSMVQKIYQSLP